MGKVLLISKNEFVIGEFEKIAALAKIDLSVTDSITASDCARHERIFVDHEIDQTTIVGNFSREALAGRAEISLVLSGAPKPQTWQLANLVQADHIALLPESRKWLVEYLSTAQTNLASAVVFASATGGCGTSTAALALARALSASGKSVVVVDLDFTSTGFDIAAGAEKTPGLKWSNLLAEATQANGQALMEALPTIDGVRILANDALTNLPELSMQLDVVNRLRHAADYVVIDTGRYAINPFISECPQAHRFLLLVNTIRACGLARELLANNKAQDMQLIIRELPGSGLNPLTIAETLNRPLAGTLPSDPKICELTEQGLALTSSSISKYNRAISQIMRVIASEDRVLRVA